LYSITEAEALTNALLLPSLPLLLLLLLLLLLHRPSCGRAAIPPAHALV
jgi:hypothetical protein